MFLQLFRRVFIYLMWKGNKIWNSKIPHQNRFDRKQTMYSRTMLEISPPRRMGDAFFISETCSNEPCRRIILCSLWPVFLSQLVNPPTSLVLQKTSILNEERVEPYSVFVGFGDTSSTTRGGWGINFVVMTWSSEFVWLLIVFLHLLGRMGRIFPAGTTFAHSS